MIMKSSQNKCIWVSQCHIQMSQRALQVHIISNPGQCDQEQKDQLLLHSRPHPQESVLSVHCLCLDCCRAHTRLLLNPVCHISGKKKANLIVCCSTFQGYRGRIWIKIRQQPCLITHDEIPIPPICCTEETQSCYTIVSIAKAQLLGFPISAISRK